LSLARKVPSVWDFETWADDLDRAVIALSRQDFATSTMLTGRWLARFPAGQLDAKGLYFHARSLVLLGDAHRDQGRLRGPQSAMSSCRRALSLYGELDIPRRVAQVELSLNVVSEMGGELKAAACGYSRLADDERLSDRDRARSRLWIGTALSKDGEHGHATRVMTEAAREFEDLGEAEDWSVAQQKLALAYRGAGNHPCPGTDPARRDRPARARQRAVPSAAVHRVHRRGCTRRGPVMPLAERNPSGSGKP
jgi:hypothetical protein